MALGRSGWVLVLLATIGLCGWLSAAEPEKATPPATPARSGGACRQRQRQRQLKHPRQHQRPLKRRR